MPTHFCIITVPPADPLNLLLLGRELHLDWDRSWILLRKLHEHHVKGEGGVPNKGDDDDHVEGDEYDDLKIHLHIISFQLMGSLILSSLSSPLLLRSNKCDKCDKQCGQNPILSGESV